MPSRLRSTIVAATSRVAPHVASRLSPSSRAASLLRPIANRVLGNGFIEVEVAGGPGRGTKLLVDAANEKFLWSGHHEPHVLAAVDRIVGPGDCVWDVGAHIGYLACFAGLRVGPAGRVVAFEPMPETRARLESGIRANGLANVDVVPLAISTTGGTQQLFAGTASASWSLEADWNPLAGDDVADTRSSIAVECTTLDAVAEGHRPPTLIKIDAEAAELDVLRSGARLIEQHSPMLLVEFTSPELVETARAEFPQYRFELLGDNHWLMTVGAMAAGGPPSQRANAG